MRSGRSRSVMFAALALGALGCTMENEFIEWDVVDIFYQNPTDAVDILMVIDNSGSMQPYQEELSTNFSQFLTYFIEADVDYHIAAVSTDVMNEEAGEIRGQIITPETPNAETAFSNIVNVGVTGAATEMGLEAAYMALTEPLVSTANGEFLREEAMLSIIFVSDEEDYSPLPVNDYINAFRDIKGQRSRDVFNASSLVVTHEAQCDDWSTRGDRYIDVAEQTAGVLGNICSDDFASIVTDLSLNTSRLRDTFHLSREPDTSTLQVTVNNEEILCDAGAWTFARVADEYGEEQPSILFDRLQMPPSDSQLAVRYYEGSGSLSNFCGATGSDTGSVEE
jgi:hypothetical protein